MQPKLFKFLSFVSFSWLLVFACGSDNHEIMEEISAPVSGRLFSKIEAAQSNIVFANNIKENEAENIFSYDYLYNGAGVGVGDFNNDGLNDIFFAGNQVDDQLYFNESDFKFTNTTEASGVNVQGWSTGVSCVDINSDGFLDIYVCRSGPSDEVKERTNVLYINDGTGKFSNQASNYGLDYSGHSSQAAFFDMDLDGDLDCYLLTHPEPMSKQINFQELMRLDSLGKLESDVLFRNDNGKFIDVSKSAGIHDFAYGLGVSLSDVNHDGKLDIYVSNDFDEGDLLYINKGNGTFKNEVAKYMKHTSNYGMGCDFGDINNDGWMDLMAVDMAFETHERSKRNMASMNPEKFYARVKLGWHYQYMYNCLQLNLGERNQFSDIAQIAGVSKTDWSWAALFTDFDLDGYQDLLITNGYRRDTKDNDLKAKVQDISKGQGNEVELGQLLDLIPSYQTKNYLFKNSGELKFNRMNDDWGIDEPLHSNGAAVADFDNDGDLDVVLNNIDGKATIYRNSSSASNAWIGLNLVSEKPVVGAKVELHSAGSVQYREIQSARGYLSSMPMNLVFGLQSNKVEKVVIQWPDGTKQSVSSKLKVGKYNSIVRSGEENIAESKSVDSMFEEITKTCGIVHLHKQQIADDFKREVLLPFKLSQNGPFMASSDVNGDGMEDVWIGGAAGFPGFIYFQRKDGFVKMEIPALQQDRGYEDQGGLFFDANGDGAMDLYVVSGSNEWNENHPALKDRLYLNTGTGGLIPSSQNLPDFLTSGLKPKAGDIDGDGDMDLFIGGRLTPGKYPSTPKSKLLINENGIFKDQTQSWSPLLEEIGMVTDAEFIDVNNDGSLDLIVVGEWMAPKVFIQEQGKFVEASNDAGSGWFYSVEAGDFDQDGDIDFIAGNVGLNTKYHPSREYPLEIFANDFDNSGTLDIVLAHYESESLLPVRGKECSTEQMPFISDKFKNYESFAKAELHEIYGESPLNSAINLDAKDFSSQIFWNDGSGNFTSDPLPRLAQIAPINDAISFTSKNRQFILCAGNMFQTEVETPRFDAGFGILLEVLSDQTIKTMSIEESGVFIPGDVKDLEIIEGADGSMLIGATNNAGYAQFFKLID